MENYNPIQAYKMVIIFSTWLVKNTKLTQQKTNA